MMILEFVVISTSEMLVSNMVKKKKAQENLKRVLSR